MNRMKSGEKIGLAFLGGGILLMVARGLYNVDWQETLSEIDPVVLVSIISIILGILILVISTLTTKKNQGEMKEMKNITKEDLRP